MKSCANFFSRCRHLNAAIFTLSLISGCGGGGSATTTPPITVTTTAIVLVSALNTTQTAGTTQQLTASTVDAAGKPVSSTINWSSTDGAVATISASGLVTALNEGTVTMTATSSLGGSANVVLTILKSMPAAVIPTINSVSAKAINVLPNAIIVPPAPLIVPGPKVPANLTPPHAEANFKLWIYDPRQPGIALKSPGIFIQKSGEVFQFVDASIDGSLYLRLGAGQFNVDVVEPGNTTSLFARRRYQVQVANTGIAVTPSAAPPVIPSNLASAPAEANLKLWIYDPRNPTVKLPPRGIFIAPAGGSFIYKAAATDGSLYLPLAPGLYTFDTVEPSGTIAQFLRHRYSVAVAATGVITIEGQVANANGVFAVTVDLAELPGAISISGEVADANGFFSVTADTIKTVPATVQQLRDKLTALANESALTFAPNSACQLLDQITPNRSFGTDLSAGFPKVRTRLPSYGHIRALIVPVDFAEVPGRDNTATFFTPLADSVRDFYLKQSYGRVAFDFEILPNWVRLPFLASKYDMGKGTNSGDAGGYRKEIISLTEELIDYSRYDAVYFLLPKEIPMSLISAGPAITFPYWTNTGYITNGASGGADMYLTGNGVNAARNRMAHETGHAFGLYDEDLDHAAPSLGSWSVMANSWSSAAIEHNGWDRYLQGWLGETQATCLPRAKLSAAGTTVKLSPLVRQDADIKVAMVPLSSSKILVMESRKNEGLDILPPNHEGVLVYTVDMKIGQLKGGYQTQRRPGSTDYYFEDAALRAGDAITVDGITVTVIDSNGNGNTINVSAK